MIKRQKLTWALLADRATSDEVRRVVAAMNARDLGKLRHALQGCEAPEKITLSWIQGQKEHGTRADLISAALMMDWAAALPVLHEAGLQATLAHLEYATKKKRAAGVKHLLDMGVNANGTRGAPPLRLLPTDDVRPEKHVNQVRIARHYAKAGADPWAQCPAPGTGMHTLVEDMLEQGHLKAVEAILEGCDVSALPPGLQQHPARLWDKLSQGCTPYLTHSTYSVMSGAHRAVLSLCERIKQLAGDPPDALMDDFWKKASGVYQQKPSSFRLSNLHALAQGLMELAPQHRLLHDDLMAFFQDKMTVLPPEMASYWMHLALQQETPVQPIKLQARMRL